MSKKHKETIPHALTRLALYIPEKGKELVVASYLEFMGDFSKEIVNRIPNQRSLVNSINRILVEPKFQRAWNKVVNRIIDIIIVPMITKMVQAIEREGYDIAVAIGKVFSRITRRAIGGIWDGAEGALSAIPGVGTVLDAFMIGQAVIDSITQISIQSIHIVTKILSMYLTISGDMIGPMAGAFKDIKRLFGIIKKAQSTNKTRKTRKRRP